MKTKNMILILIVVIVLFHTPGIVYASYNYPGYPSYTYSYWGDPVPAPYSYLPSLKIDTRDLGIGSLRGPEDMYVHYTGLIYIADTGNNRIIVLDDTLELEGIIDSFEKDGFKQSFNSPEGVFVTEDKMLYIADTANQRIIVLDSGGRFVNEIGKPEDELIDPDEDFLPSKIVVDNAMRIFAIAKNEVNGLMEFDVDGNFRGFIGATKVTPNPIELFWQRVLTREQVARMSLFVPTEYNNIAIDERGFMYTTVSAIESNLILNAIRTRSKDDRAAPIRKLHPAGEDVLNRSGYFPPVGDIDFPDRGSVAGPSALVDISYEGYGIFSVLDRRRGRIFTYDDIGNLLYIFGGLGDVDGTFKQPVAIDNIGERVLVMDRQLNTITVFDPTEYAMMIRQAVKYHFLGRYPESIRVWSDILEYNSNLDLAYIGLGRGHLMEDEFSKAMENFRLGNSREHYTRAFQLYRKEVVGDNFSLLMAGVFSVIVFIRITIKIRKKFMKRSSK